MALALKDRVKETTIVVGTGAATLLGSSIGFQPFSVVGNGNTTYYCISDQFGSNWEVGIGTYSSSGNTLDRTTILASSNGGALVVFTAGVKDVFVTYPAEKGVWLDASNNAIGLGTPAAFVGTNITGTASGLTAGNVTTNANLTGAVTSTGNATSLGSFTSLQLATALTDETGSGSAVFATSPTLANPTYTGTLTGSTGILNIGSGQLYKDASGNVGIGTASPATKLDVNGNTRILSGSYLALFESSNSNQWQFKNNTNNLTFTYNSTEAIRIASSGNVTLQKNISVGAAAPTTSGTGITFPSTASPSTDAYTLDDYREGTYTPVVSSITGTITSYTSSASYIKIGRVVTIGYIITITNNGTGAGNVAMTLPFTIGSQYCSGVARENALTGNTVQVFGNPSGTQVLFNYNNVYPAVTGSSFIGSLTYISA
jgi:hypothetical protein